MEDSLFQQAKNSTEPLAARMRPRNLDEYIGQDHIVGKGRLLRRAIAADQITSIIFYGPPGSGKTTLAKVIANHTRSHFITLNAVLAGVKEIRDAIKQAEDYNTLYNIPYRKKQEKKRQTKLCTSFLLANNYAYFSIF